MVIMLTVLVLDAKHRAAVKLASATRTGGSEQLKLTQRRDFHAARR